MPKLIIAISKLKKKIHWRVDLYISSNSRYVNCFREYNAIIYIANIWLSKPNNQAYTFFYFSLHTLNAWTRTVARQSVNHCSASHRIETCRNLYILKCIQLSNIVQFQNFNQIWLIYTKFSFKNSNNVHKEDLIFRFALKTFVQNTTRFCEHFASCLALSG